MTSRSLWARVVAEEPPIDSAVDFPTRSRFHVALNVKDVEGLMPFYAALFGKAADVHRDGYAKFESHAPAINLSLNRVVHNAKGHGRFGIRGVDRSAADAIFRRLRDQSGIEPPGKTSPDEDGFVAVDPEQNRWEIQTN